MKAVALLLVLAAAFAQAQLSYEQATYTDNAAPAILEDAQPVEAEAMEAGASFAEVQEESTPGAFSAAAHQQQRAVKAVQGLFNKRKNGGGNISPSKRVLPKGWRRSARRAPRPAVKALKAAKKAAKKAKKAAKKAMKKAIIDAKAGKKATKKAKKAQKKAKKAAKKLRKLLGKKGGKRVFKKGGKKGGKRRGLRFPKAPAAARGDNIWHSERWIPKDSPNRDPEMAKLNLALEAVKEDILSTNKQINEERRWVIAVSKIIKSYNTKMQRVEAHIIALRKEMKMLYRKKKQIENLKLQRALQAKLKEAKGELKTLTNSLQHVAKKQGALNKSGRQLRGTIAGIQAQLAKLRGQRLFKKCGKGKAFSRKSRKCVCKKGTKWSRKSKKCVRKAKRAGKAGRKGKKGRRGARKAKRAARK